MVEPLAVSAVWGALAVAALAGLIKYPAALTAFTAHSM